VQQIILIPSGIHVDIAGNKDFYRLLVMYWHIANYKRCC